MHLAERLAAAAGDRTFTNASDLSLALVGSAEILLQHLTDDRTSATDLLVADALITYAMEAAADNCDDVDRIAAEAAVIVASAMLVQ